MGNVEKHGKNPEELEGVGAFSEGTGQVPPRASGSGPHLVSLLSTLVLFNWSQFCSRQIYLHWKRITQPVASMYGIFTYRWLISMVNCRYSEYIFYNLYLYTISYTCTSMYGCNGQWDNKTSAKRLHLLTPKTSKVNILRGVKHSAEANALLEHPPDRYNGS